VCGVCVCGPVVWTFVAGDTHAHCVLFKIRDTDFWFRTLPVC
jgi:hypothetical protein